MSNSYNWQSLSSEQFQAIDSFIDSIASLPLESLAPACNSTTKTVGEVVHMKAKPSGGTAPYKVDFYKGSTIIHTIANVAENADALFDYTTVTGDVSTTPIVFKETVTDSCPTSNGGPKSSTEQCSVTVSAATPGCAIPTVNMTLS